MAITFIDLNKQWGKRPLVGEVVEFQAHLLQNVMMHPENTDNYCIHAEHEPVYTYTTETKKMFRSAGKDQGRPLDIPLFAVKRAGGMTYHGPGQLVYYFVLNLDFFPHVNVATMSPLLDESIIEALHYFSVTSHQKPKQLPPAAGGVWVTERNGQQKKIASRGVAFKRNKNRQVTQFGFALNVNTNLEPFSRIYPCGLDITMTSMQEVLGKTLALEDVAHCLNDTIIKKFEQKEKAS